MTGSQKMRLRGLAQNMKPLLHIGKNGLAGACVKEMDTLLGQHELVKVKYEIAERAERKKLSEELAAKTSSACVGAVGRTAVFHRQNPDPTKRVVAI